MPYLEIQFEVQLILTVYLGLSNVSFKLLELIHFPSNAYDFKVVFFVIYKLPMQLNDKVLLAYLFLVTGYI